MSVHSVVELDNVAKQYPRTAGYRELVRFWRPRRYITALDGVDLDIPKGGTFGLLGANGAGKTTLLKILAGLVLADQGDVVINGEDVTREPKRARESLMYVSVEERSLYWRLTGRQNLQFFAMQHEIPRHERGKRVDELLSFVGLEEAAHEHVMRYSTGMRQRLAIARGLLSDPDILLLDEPTRSVDPVTARRMWGFIRRELAENREKTVIIATHNMEEADFLCDRVAILNRGQVELCDSVSALTSRLTGRGHYSLTVGNAPWEAIERLGSLAGVSSVVAPPKNGHRQIDLQVVVDEPDRDIPMVVEELVRSGGHILNVERNKASLGDLIASLDEAGRL